MNDVVYLNGATPKIASLRLVMFVAACSGEICQLPQIYGDSNLYPAKHISIALKQLRNDGNTKDMMRVLRAGLRAFPKDGRLWHFAGTLAHHYGYHAEAQKFFEKGLVFAPQDKYLKMALAESCLVTKDIKKARDNINWMLKNGGSHVSILVTAAQIELEAYKAGDQGALKTARDLAQRLLDIADDHPAILVTAAQIELEADSPETALKYIERIPESTRRKNDVVTYIEAKAYMRSGFEGKAKQLITPIIQTRPDEAFTTLYLSCFEDDGKVGMFKTILGQGFTAMWENSRDIRTKIHATPEAERKFFYGSNYWWDLGASAINSAALGQMAALPQNIRRSLAERTAAKYG